MIGQAVERVRQVWRSARARWSWLAVAGDVQQRFNDIHGGYLASAVTLASFVALFPLMLVGIAVLGFFSSGHPDIAGRLLDNLAIPANSGAADTVTGALRTAEESRKAASIVGLIGLLWSGLGLVGALQYVYDSVWQVTGRGIRDKLMGLLWLVGAALLFAASFGVTTLMHWLPGLLAPIDILVGLGLGGALFLWAAKLLPNVDVGWRPLLPGAIVGAVGLEVLKALGGIYVPRAVASSSALYGSLGVVFAILAWLFFFGRLIVYANVLNVVLWERGHGTVVLDLRAPSLPGREEPEATRDGEMVRSQPVAGDHI